jgi:[protein-PII] uridylyltransferase
MSVPGSFQPVVLAAREKLRSGRERLKAQHQSGSPGLQLTHLQTDLVDGVILELYETAIRDLRMETVASQLALVAHGGYGRRDLAPFSDCDLMLTPLRRVERSLKPLAARLSRDIVDVGLQLGFSVRRPDQACAWAWKDPTIFSSLCESRLLTGSIHVFGRFFHSFRLGAMRRHKRLIAEVYQARRDERGKWGETVYLLRPNVKRSRGGLRDIQLIRWLGFARYGDSDLDKLLHLGALSEDDYSRLRKALAFLLRLRNELHFDSGKSQDILDRPAQMRIAERWGYQDASGRLAVEAFMQDYFEHTREIRYVAAHFVDTVRSRPVAVRSLDLVLSRRLTDDFRMGPYHIWAREQNLRAVAGDVCKVMQLMELANRYQRRISHRTWQAIRDAMRGQDLGPPDAETAKQFLALMGRPGRLADLLRRLHELRVLEKIIPGMRHARCLLQFNEYHKYTVDAHSIRAVEAATMLIDQKSRAGEIYRGLNRVWLLHLSLLIHDLGKGFPRDHSEIGAEIAAETAKNLNLQPQDAADLGTLVYHHLLMNHTALRHDLTDPQLIASFCEAIPSIELLDMLLVHSICDLTAVGPDVLTDWKENLLYELHQRAKQCLMDGGSTDNTDHRIHKNREATRKELLTRRASPESIELLDQLPIGLLDTKNPKELADNLVDVAEIHDGDRVRCWGKFLEDQDATQYTVVFRQGERPVGLFMLATGELTSRGLEILRSQILTLDSGLAWDEFVVSDPDFVGKPPAAHIDDVCRGVKNALLEPPTTPPRFRAIWNPQAEKPIESLQVLPCRATFDNETSDHCTVVSIFAYDRPGLLYSLARVIADAELVIHFAKIATHLDQAVDVFYLTELDGGKILSADRQSELRARFIEAAKRTA